MRPRQPRRRTRSCGPTSLSALVNLGYQRPLAERAIDAAMKAVERAAVFEAGAATRRCRGSRDDLAAPAPLAEHVSPEARVTDPRIVNATRDDDDLQYEAGLRPRTLDEYIGQDRVRENLSVAIAAARQRREALDHVLLYGPPGLGKTTLALRDRERDWACRCAAPPGRCSRSPATSPRS